MNKDSEAFGSLTNFSKLYLHSCKGLKEYPLGANNLIMLGFEEYAKRIWELEDS